MVNSSKPVILTTLTHRGLVDIIYPATINDKNLICSYLNSNKIGFDLISEEDGAKLLLPIGGIGLGCYLHLDDGSASENDYRIMESQLRYADLSSIVGMITMAAPKQFVLPVVTNGNEQRQRIEGKLTLRC